MQEFVKERKIKMKIVIHIDQTERWKAVQGNLKNLANAKKDLRPDLDVEVVVTGEAINQLIDNDENQELKEALNSAVNAGFVIAGCNNSLNRFEIAPEDIFSFVRVVPAGLIEIVEKEDAGFAYVKP